MRPGVTWIIVGAVAVIVVFAGLDALRSGGGEPTPSEASATGVTTTRTEADVGIESSRELQQGRIVKLIPGRVTVDFFVEMAVAFTVPDGWYGYQGPGVLLLGKGLTPGAGGVRVASGGIAVNALDFPLAPAARRLETATGIRVHNVSAVRIGGYPGRRYSLIVTEPVSLQEELRVGLEPGEPDVILLGVRQQRTLVIRRAFDNDQVRPEIERVVMSFAFLGPEQEIKRIGDSWARLFGTGRRCNRFMHQPACEWVACERPGERAIQNCTPVSSKVQRSFAGAVVQDTVIRGKWAAARFSNGETVKLQEILGGDGWWIDRVGAGRKFFE
jgi:hypothetical protein